MLTSNRCVSSKSLQRIVSTFFVFCILPTVAVGQVWSGGAGDREFYTATNWLGFNIPAPNAPSVIFNSDRGLAGEVKLGAGYIFGRSNSSLLEFDSSSGNGVFDLTGGPLTIAGGANISVNGSGNSISADVILAGESNIFGSSFAFNGDISGSGNLILRDSTKILNGSFSSAGELDIREGALILNGNINNGLGSVIVGINAALLGNGEIARAMQIAGTLQSNGGSLTLRNQSSFFGTASFGGNIVLDNVGLSMISNSATANVRQGANISGVGSMGINGSLQNAGDISFDGILQINVNAELRAGNVNGSIVNGTISSEVRNAGTIGGNTFNGTVINNGIIQDGTFNGFVDSSLGRFEEGQFNGLVRMRRDRVVGNTTFTDVIVANGGSFGDPNAQTSFSADSLINGLLTVESGRLSLDSGVNIDGTGSITVNGDAALNLNGNSQVSLDVFLEKDAILNGNGTINGQVLLDGEIAPGNSAGTLEIDGNLVLADTAMTSVEIGGTIAGTDYDQIRGGVDGNSTVQIDGVLDIALIEGFIPNETDSFLIFDNFSFTGRFSNTVNGRIRIGENSFAINYGGDALSRSSTSGITLSDFRFDAVPEPTGLAFASLLACAICTWRRRRA